MVVEKKVLVHLKIIILICYCLVIIVKTSFIYYKLACLQYTRDVYRNILKINNVTSLNNT